MTTKTNQDKMNSLLYWYPLIKDLDIPTPKTLIFPVTEEEVFAIIDGDALKSYPEIVHGANKLGYPLFMRTDYFSSKHNWLETCYIKEEGEILHNILSLVEDSCGISFVGLPIGAIVLREFLPLNYSFRAFRGLPIAREVRVFINNGDVEAIYAYWPQAAIRFWGDTIEPKNWHMMLQKLYTFDEGDLDKVITHSVIISDYMKGYWSVDFAQDKYDREKWWLIDMALGDCSYRGPDKDKIYNGSILV